MRIATPAVNHRSVATSYTVRSSESRLKWSTALRSGVRWWMKKGWDQASGGGQRFVFPLMFWCCWYGDRKEIRPLKPVPLTFKGSLSGRVAEANEGEPASWCVPAKKPLPSNRHHRSSGDCLEGKGENYQVCSVQYCVQQLCTVGCTLIWTDLTVL